MADDREYFQLCGFMLMARLLMKGNQLNERAEAEFLDQALTSLQSEELLPQKQRLQLCVSLLSKAGRIARR